MPANTFNELYIEELKDLYSAERQLIEALPRVAKGASTPELAEAITAHLAQTEGHVQRLEQIFKDLGEKPTGKHCKAMEGLIAEGKEVLKDQEKGPVRDAALIAGSQKIEHYEISGYGTMCTFAQRLGREADVKLLQQTLDEESAADEKLTEIAESVVNPEAEMAGSAK